MRSILSYIAALFVVLSSFGAAAQDQTTAAEGARENEEIKGNTRVVDIHQVERGFFVGADAGANYMLGLTQVPGFVFGDDNGNSSPVAGININGQRFFAPVNESWVDPGPRVGLRLGYDVANNINIEAFLLGTYNQGRVKQDLVQTGVLTGDLVHFAPGVAGRYSFIADDRLFVYVKGGLGLSLWFPPELAGASLTGLAGIDDLSVGIFAQLALGVEYYTKLRHISVGFEAGLQASLLPTAIGLFAQPHIKYTF